MELTYVHLVLALLAGLTASGPINLNLFKDDKTCAKRCIAVKTINYEVGTMYRYTYSALSRTLVVGASENDAFVKIESDVEIETTSPCDFVMRLKNTRLSDSEEKSVKNQPQVKFSATLESHPLRFSFQSGRIEDLCPNHDEPTWSLNIKRGVLSALQSAMEGFSNNQTFIETDVNGDCETQYSAVSTSRVHTITKTKDLTKCKRRQEYNTAIQSIGYSIDSGIQSLPILKSSYECQQRIDSAKKHLLESSCTETNVFRPFSSGNNGASNINTQTLKFAGLTSSRNTQTEPIDCRTDLSYEHEHGEKKRDLDSEIGAHLRTVCQELEDVVRPGTPSSFYKLVKLMRQVDSSATLNALHSEVSGGKVCRKNHDQLTEFFMDAIPMLGTVASVEFMTKRIMDQTISNARETLWLASFPFIPNPTKSILEIMKHLLDKRHVRDNMLLIVSSVVNGYCHDNPRCAEDEVVKDIISRIDTIVGDCKWKDSTRNQPYPYQARGQPLHYIIHALRALGNIGRSESVGRILTRCFTISSNLVDLRLAAINAFRRVPCEASRTDLEHLFYDVSEDSEIRINAYLALMKCPTETLLMGFHRSLHTENSQQVKSFMLSHLNNLKTTSDPHFQNVRAILEDPALATKFPSADADGSNMDVRKYSRNYEGSVFFDSVGAGGKFDSNVIFSSKSFVPRSGNVNLTLDVFGHAVNFLEVGGRVEGLEHFLESYFGPSGHLKSKSGSESNSKFPIPGIDDNFKATTDKLQGSAYFRIFGNELGYWQTNDGIRPSTTSWLKDININKLMQQFVKRGEMSFEKSSLLLDMKLTVPTCIGLPLNLSFTATGSVKMEAMGKINMPSFKNMEIVGTLSPSAAIDVTGEMSVDAFASRAGLRMSTVAHTNTAAKVTFNMKDRQVVTSSFELLREKMEVVNLKSDFFIVHRNSERKQRMIQKNAVNRTRCTGATFSKVTGLDVCMQVQYSNASMDVHSPFFPLTGPMTFKLDVTKSDLPKGYQMEAKLMQSQKFGFNVNTPESKTNRRISVDVDVGETEVNIEVDSPWRKFSFNGKTEEKPKFSISGEFQVDYKNKKIDKYGASFTMLKSREKQVVKWAPKFEIHTPSKQWIAEGKIKKIQDKNLTGDFSAIGFFNHNISIKFFGERVKKSYTSFITLRLNDKRYSTEAKFGQVAKGRGTVYSANLDITLPSRKPFKLSSRVIYNPEQKMGFDVGIDNVFSSKVVVSSLVIFNKKKMDNILKFSIKSPKLTVAGKGNVQLKSAYFTAHLACSYKLFKNKDKLVFDAKLWDESNPNSSRYRANMSFISQTYPKRNTLIAGKFNRNKKRIETTLDVQLGKNNPEKLQTMAALNYDFTNIENTLSYNMKIKDEHRGVDFELDVDHIHRRTFPPKKIASTVKVMYATGKSLKLNFKHDMESQGNARTRGGEEVRGGGLKTCSTVLEVTYLKKKMTISNQLKIFLLYQYDNSLTVSSFDGKELNLNTSYVQSKGGLISITNTLVLPDKKQVRCEVFVDIDTTANRYRLAGNFAADKGALTDDEHAYGFDAGTTVDDGGDTVDGNLVVRWARSQAMMFKFSRLVSSSSGDRSSSSTVMTLDVTTPFKKLDHLSYRYSVARTRNSVALEFDAKSHNYKRSTVMKWRNDTLDFEYSNTEVIGGSGGVPLRRNRANIKLMDNDKMFKFVFDVKSNDVVIQFMTSLDKDTVKNFQYKFLYDIQNIKLQSGVQVMYDLSNFDFTSNGTVWYSVGNDNIFKSAYSVLKTWNKSLVKGNFALQYPGQKLHDGSIEYVSTYVKDNVDGRFNVNYDGKLLYSHVLSYKHKQDNVSLKTEMIFPNQGTLTVHTDVKLSRRRTLVSRIVLTRKDESPLNITIESSFKFEPSKSLDTKLEMTTNHQYLTNCVMHLNYRKKNDNNKVTTKMNIFGNKINTVTSLDGSDWLKKSFSFKVNKNGFDVISASGDYEYDPIGDLTINMKGSTKQISDLEQLSFNLRHLLSSKRLARSKEKNHLEIGASAKVDGDKYEFATKVKYFNKLVVTVTTPTPRNGFALNMDLNDKNRINMDFNLKYDDVPYIIHFQKEGFNMTFTASLPPLKEINVKFSGGMGKDKKGDFKFRASYNKHFIQTDILVSFRNFFQTSVVSSFDILSVTGSGEVKLTHYFDQLFTQFSADMKYNTKEISFSIMAKSRAFVVKLKTPYDFDVSAEINNMSRASTSLKLIVKTPWSDKRTVKYFHTLKKGGGNNALEIGLDVKNAVNELEFGLDVNLNLKPVYKVDVTVTLKNKSKKYFLIATLDPKGDKTLATLKCNWDQDSDASNFEADIEFLNKHDSKKLQVTINHPARSFGFSLKTKTSGDTAEMLTTVHWDIEKGKKITFAIGTVHWQQYYLKIIYPQRTLKFVVGFDDTKTTRPFMAAFLWDADRDDTKQMLLTVHAKKTDGYFTSDLALSLMPANKIFQWRNNMAWGQKDKPFHVESSINIDHDPAREVTLEVTLQRTGGGGGGGGGGYEMIVSVSQPRRGREHAIKLRAWFDSSSSSMPGGAAASLGIKLSYGTVRGNTRTFLLEGRYDQVARELNVTMQSPLTNVWLIFNMRMDKDYEFSFVKKEGKQSIVETYMIISPSRKSAKLKIDYDKRDPSKSYLVDAKLMSDTLLVVKAFHSSSQQQPTTAANSKDIDMQFRVDKQMLRSKINWRPGMLQDLKNFLMLRIQQSLGEMSMLTTQAEMMIRGELMEAAGALAQVGMPDVNLVVSYLKGEMVKVTEDSHVVNNELKEMYDRNYLNVRHAVNETRKGMARAAQVVGYHLRRAYAQVRGEMKAFDRMLRQRFGMALDHALKVYPTTVVLYVGKAMKLSFMAIQQWYEEWSEWHSETFQKFENLSAKDILNEIRQNMYFHIIELAFRGDWRQLSFYLHQQTEDLLQVLARSIDLTLDTLESTNIAVQKIIVYLSQQLLTQDIVSLANELYQQVLWAWKYWGLDQFLERADIRAKSYVMAWSEELKRQIFNRDPMFVHTFDPHRGRLKLDISLTLPQLIVNTTRHAVRAWDVLNQFFTIVDEWLVQYLAMFVDLYSSASSSHFSDLIPPFKAIASLFSDQHYITFDGQYYKFRGECSYVLTRDFVDNNFTVIAKYQAKDGSSKLASVLFYNGAQKIEIFPSYMVRYNDREINLPLKLSDATVLRWGPSIRVSSEKGLKLSYNPLREFLTVEISGWYFGKVAGLFGTYDNEYSGELTTATMSSSSSRSGMMPGKQPRLIYDYIDYKSDDYVGDYYDAANDAADDEYSNKKMVGNLAHSWAMPGCGRSSTENFAESNFAVDLVGVCPTWFNTTSSPFSDCFDHVAPQHYYDMCLAKESTDGGTCAVAQFYIHQCATQGISIKLPGYCILCPISTGPSSTKDETIYVFTEDSSKIEDTKNSADVIFVVEERECNKEAANEIKVIAQTLDRIFERSGMKHIRYGLVGFAGKNMPAQYSRTMRSKLLFSAGDFPGILQEIKYDGFAGSDPMEAVQFATMYPFRSGLRKTIVLVSCNPGVEKTDHYYDAFAELKRQDIALHLLQDYTFRTTQNRNTKTILYGVDRDKAFAKGEVEQEVFDYIQLPKDYYGQLALASNGSLFDARVLGKPAERRSFVLRFAQRVADSVEVDECLHCHCAVNDMEVIQSQCRRCSHVSSSSYFSLGQTFFQQGLTIDESIKLQFSMYWKRFKKTPSSSKNRPHKNRT